MRGRNGHGIWLCLMIRKESHAKWRRAMRMTGAMPGAKRGDACLAATPGATGFAMRAWQHVDHENVMTEGPDVIAASSWHGRRRGVGQADASYENGD